ELGAAVATITKSGIKTTEAMSGLRGVLSAVLKQSDQSVKMAKTLGVEFSATALKADGLSLFLKKIADSGATTEQLAKLFGRVEGLTAVLSLGAEGAAEFNKQLAEMEKSAGATDVAVAKMMETTAQKAARASAAIEVLAIGFGEKFLASVANASTIIVDNMDKIASAIEAVVLLLTVRLGAAGINSILAAAAATSRWAVAAAFLGGPIGASALALAGLLIMLDRYHNKLLIANETTKVSGRLLTANTEYFIALGDAAVNAAHKIELSAKLAQLAESMTRINTQLKVANKNWKTWDRTVGSAHSQTKKFLAVVQGLENELLNTSNVHAKYFDALQKVIKATKEIIKETEGAAEGVKDLGKRLTETEVFLRLFNQEAEVSSGAIADLEAWVRRLTDEMDPLGAETMRVRNDIIDLDIALENQLITMEEYDRLLAFILEGEQDWRDSLKDTTKEFDLMQVAMDEGTRILERSFASMWQSLLDGSNNVFDTILDGFKSLLASLIHQATTQKIILNIQSGIAGKGTGPGGGIDFGQLGVDLAAFAGIIAGTSLGGGGTGAAIGAGLGALGGGAAGAVFGAIIGGPVGMKIGSAIGAAIGGILGGLLGGLFDKKDRFILTLGGGNTQFGDTGQRIDSDLGGFRIFDSHDLDASRIAEFTQGIVEFDNALAKFMDDEQLAGVTKILDKWAVELVDSGLTLEQF
ncbi:MAG: phage tail tape measure protein, partial [Acidiferrobacterales bacterium]